MKNEEKSDLELLSRREEALLDLVKAVIALCRHRREIGVGPHSEAQMFASSKHESALCEAARAFAAWDDVYSRRVDDEVALTLHAGNDTHN